ncbi:hypothetical protein AMTR_s00041p00200870 [Amborella trichopoda]|uniref:Uncharacterized protein n=1 Tax=Amborella trichopoda TaxID=13333 RepID=W1Q0H1_AMBTC|nr:hypothetical protein AMTR_s00041p00200870 [Amborella trichopoda]
MIEELQWIACRLLELRKSCNGEAGWRGKLELCSNGGVKVVGKRDKRGHKPRNTPLMILQLT